MDHNEIVSHLPLRMHQISLSDISYERLSTSAHPSLMRCILTIPGEKVPYVGYSGSSGPDVSDDSLKPRAWAEAAHAAIMRHPGIEIGS